MSRRYLACKLEAWHSVILILCLPFLLYAFNCLCLLFLPAEDFLSPCILSQHVYSFPISSFFASWYARKSFLHMCLPSIMYPRCLALPPHSVWVILPRTVPWCSARTLWTTLRSEQGSLSVYVPPAAQPKTLSIALAPTLLSRATKASAPIITLWP